MPHSWPTCTSRDFVLEALERRQRAFVDDDVVADEPHLGAALHRAFGDPAAGDLADLGDVEDLEDLAHCRGRSRAMSGAQQTGHGLS